MKIFPIKSERVTKTNHKVINWALHNVCNYDCSFCGSDNKIGDRRWQSLETYKKYADKLLKATGPNPWFLISGGEPTLYPDFIELMSYLKSKGAYIFLITNGSRTLRWWKELQEANVLDSLYISYHTEQSSDYEHIANVLNLFHEFPTKTACLITHTNTTIDLAIEASEYLYLNTGSKIEIKHMNIVDYDLYGSLTTEQLSHVKKIHIGIKPNKTPSNIPLGNQYENSVLLTYNDGSTELFSGSQEIIKKDKNHFKDWYCYVYDTIISVNVNLCSRGQIEECKVSGVVADLDVDEIEFIDDYVKCPYDSCYCSSNIFSTKYKNINDKT